MIINGFEIEKYNIHGITEGADKWTCPECSASRKKSTQKCMSVFWDTGLGRCNHCGAQVQLHSYKKRKEVSIRQYIKPKPLVKAETHNDKVINWFKSRGISKATVERMRITSGITGMPVKGEFINRNAIMFPYFRDDELVNVKYRDGEKNFKLEKGAERILYNLDGIRTTKECIVVEGELDMLSYAEIGRWDTVSLPNGASLKGVNLDWLDSAIDYFENKDVIYIGLDNDAAGINTQKEIVRRLGADKCRLIDMMGYKDPNEILMNNGAEALLASIENAKEVPIENVSSVGDWESEYDHFLVNGMKGGYNTGMKNLDNIFSTYTGQFITMTGIPSCVTGDTLVQMADGSQKRIDSIRAGEKVLSIDENYKAVEDTVETQWEAGIKDVYKVKLKSGREIRSTKEHAYMTFHGMRELNSIKVGDFIGTLLNAEFYGNEVTEDEAVLMAIWMADGNKSHDSYFVTNSSPEIIDKIKEIAGKYHMSMSTGRGNDHILGVVKPLDMTYSRYLASTSYWLRNSKGMSMDESKRIANEMYSSRAKDVPTTLSPMGLLEKHGLKGMTTNNLRVPDSIFRSSNEVVSTFLSYLFSCDGSAYGNSIEYYSNSRQLCEDVSSLLMRFGVRSFMYVKNVKYKGEYRIAYRVAISGRPNISRFYHNIGMRGSSARVEKVYQDSLERMHKGSEFIPSTVKAEFNHGDKYYRKRLGVTARMGDKSRYKMSADIARIIAEHEDNPSVLSKLNGSLNWDEVVSIEYVGKEMTYDIEVNANGNFIANGLNVSNSGKSEMLDSMCIGYNLNHGWKVAYASPENKPNVIHASKLEAKLVGQWVNSKEQIQTEWHRKAKEHIDDNFKFIDLERFTLEAVLEKAKEMIRRYGIKVLVIDPYNKVRLEGSLNKNINDYTNDYLAKIDEFARTNDILIVLVAHPRKPGVGENAYIPTMYDIKGGGEFYDMSPHGLLVHRDFNNDATMIKVLKCKFSFLGENGAQCWYKWNKDNGRYSEFRNHSDKVEECTGVMYDNTNLFAPQSNESEDGRKLKNPLDIYHNSPYSMDDLPF